MKSSFKHFLAAFIAVCLIFTQAACGGDGSNASSTPDSSDPIIVPDCEHDLVKVDGQLASCDTEGYITHYVCNLCGYKFKYTSGKYVAVSDADIVIAKRHNIKDKDAVAEIESTCSKNGVKAHYVCPDCGKLFIKQNGEYKEATENDLKLKLTSHVYDQEVRGEKYVKKEATSTTKLTYVKSCVCGAADDRSSPATFTVGKTMGEYEAITDTSGFVQSAITLSLYDAESCTYGFTWNTTEEPARPKLKISEGETLGSDYTTVSVSVNKAQAYLSNYAEIIDLYVCKAQIQLTPDTKYTYVLSDDYMNVVTEPATFTAVNPDETSFKFVHVSDSQVNDSKVTSATAGDGTGADFAKVLNNIDEQTRFVLHTGDVVEYGRFENYWAAMLNENSSNLRKMPMMAISGNHETTYSTHESIISHNATFNHFNYNIPEQDVTLGFFYSFTYGDVKFIMINTNRLNGSNRLTDDQYQWLVNELENNTKKWTIVSMHNPIYSVGKWGSATDRNQIAMSLKRQLASLFATYGVDLVLQGHDHMVSRTFPINADLTPAEETIETVTIGETEIGYSVNPDGTIYLMHGAAGNQAKSSGEAVVSDADKSLYSFYDGSNPSSWAEIEVNGDYLTVTLKNASKETVAIERVWGIKKVQE